MRTLAMIAEYNPFHNGHAYLLRQAKALTQADCAIAVMSGNFLQRGEAAMWDKFTRAKMAAMSGIDAVFELPFVYAAGSARDFAAGAVSVLDKLGFADYLCFGAETCDEEAFMQIAEILVREPDIYKAALRRGQSGGLSYPAARERAVFECLSGAAVSSSETAIHDILSLPNNILALEYICALKRRNSRIQPVFIQRTTEYHDARIHGNISSAKAIRTSLLQTKNPELCEKDVPFYTSELIKTSFDVCSPVYTEDLSIFLQSARISKNRMESICDFTPELAARLAKLPLTASYSELIGKLHTKNNTAGRIARALLHMLAGYTEADRTAFQNADYCFYANLLSLRREHSALLRQAWDNRNLPIINKKGDFRTLLAPETKKQALRMWELDMTASNLYSCLVFNRYGYKLSDDYHQTIPIV